MVKRISKEITNQDLARQMASGFKQVAKGFKGVTSEIKQSQEELARMVAEGFVGVDKGFRGVHAVMVTKDDLVSELAGIKQDLEDLKLKFDHVAYKFEVKDLEKRMAVVERKIGVR